MFRFAPTRYDLQFSLFGVPVRVHPLHWLLGVYLGATSGDPIQIPIWIGVIFFSILLHEFGHSMAMRRFGWDSYIVLHMLGGYAVPTSSRGGRNRDTSRTWLEQVIISLAGPFSQFLFAALILAGVLAAGGFVFRGSLAGFIPFPVAFLPIENPIAESIIDKLIYVNIFWGLFNLLPVIPMDGGRVAQAIFVRFDPWNGVTNALWLSVLTGTIFAVIGFVWWRSIFMAFLFGSFAVQSYQMLKYGGGRTF